MSLNTRLAGIERQLPPPPPQTSTWAAKADAVMYWISDDDLSAIIALLTRWRRAGAGVGADPCALPETHRVRLEVESVYELARRDREQRDGSPFEYVDSYGGV